MTTETLRRAFASPLARDPRAQSRFAVYLPDGSGPVDPTWPPDGREPRPAAVLVILVLEEGSEPRVVLTRRTDEITSHPGQISFPGGTPEAGDGHLVETALRETEEEIAVTRGQLELLGELAPVYIPPTNYHVTPFVAIHAGSPSYVANPLEVAEILEVPLSFFFEPESVVRERWTLRGAPFLVPHYRWRSPAGASHAIWGATARMLAMLTAAIDATRHASRSV